MCVGGRGGLSWCNARVCSVVPCADSVFVFITYFDIPAILICARLVDHCDKTGVPYAFTDDLFAAFNYTFDPEAFESTWRCLFHASVNVRFSTTLPPPSLVSKNAVRAFCAKPSIP